MALVVCSRIFNSGLGGLGPIRFCPEFGLAPAAFVEFLGRPFAKPVGPKAEFIKSVSAGLGPISFCPEFGLAPAAFV